MKILESLDKHFENLKNWYATLGNSNSFKKLSGRHKNYIGYVDVEFS